MNSGRPGGQVAGELLDRVKAALAGLYDVERELGQGGMATVYLARDKRHDRQVAVKVLRPELAVTLGPDRFLREVRIAAQLTHPHILPLHDSGEANGFLYYVMPYIEGESLRDRLAREGALPIPDAVRVLREMADALGHAHAMGVVHRDIKPDNVMLFGRHAIVMDFGVAKAISEAAGSDNLTTAGVALGTPAYMAPEQATGDAKIDHRADIYALGCVAYELLVGRVPIQGPNTQATLAAQVTERPRPLAELRENVPSLLTDLVMRCLEKNPADRVQGAAELAERLEVLAASSGAMTPTSLALGGAARSGRRRAVVPIAGFVTIVAAATLLVLRDRDVADGPVAVEQHQVTFTGDVRDAVVSPDGQFLAYLRSGAEGFELRMRDLATESELAITTDSARLCCLQWAADGTHIWVSRPFAPESPDGMQYRYRRLGGEAVGLMPGSRTHHEKDGLLWREQPGWGGSSAPLTLIMADSVPTILGVYGVSVSAMLGVARHPERDLFAFVDASDDYQRAFVHVLSADPFTPDSIVGMAASTGFSQAPDTVVHVRYGSATAEPVNLPEGAPVRRVAWSPFEHALYLMQERTASAELWKLEVTPRGEVSGTARSLVRGLQAFLPVDDPFNWAADHGISLTSDARQLYYLRGERYANLASISITGGEARSSPVTTGTAVADHPSVSPDGKTVAYTLERAGRRHVHLVPLTGGASQQIAGVDSVNGTPRWSPDGRRLAVPVTRGGQPTVAIVPIDGSWGADIRDEIVLNENARILWLPDGRIAAQQQTHEGWYHYTVYDLDSGESVPLVDMNGRRGWIVDVVPDRSGDRLALWFNAGQRDSLGVWVVDRIGGAPRPVAVGTGQRPIGWSADGRTVYVMGYDLREIRAVSADGGPLETVAVLHRRVSDYVEQVEDGIFVVSELGQNVDVWMIENFDPDLR